MRVKLNLNMSKEVTLEHCWQASKEFPQGGEISISSPFPFFSIFFKFEKENFLSNPVGLVAPPGVVLCGVTGEVLAELDAQLAGVLIMDHSSSWDLSAINIIKDILMKKINNRIQLILNIFPMTVKVNIFFLS